PSRGSLTPTTDSGTLTTERHFPCGVRNQATLATRATDTTSVTRARRGRMRKTFLSILALSLLVSALSLAPSASSAPVATGYTASEYRDLTGAANYLNVTPEYLQRFGVRTIHFILGISGKLGTKGDVYYNVIDANGPYKFTSDYVGEDLESILVVMDYHTVTPQQAQKIGAAFMTFISGLDAAQKGVDIEKFKQNPPTTTKPTTTTKPKPTTTTSTT